MFAKLRPLDWSSPRRGLAAGAATAAVVVGVSLARQRARAGAARRAVEARRGDAASARTALAESLADASRHTLLTFQSSDCTLCDALKAPLQEVGRVCGVWGGRGTAEHTRRSSSLHTQTNQVAAQEDGWLDIVTIDADNGEAWALEVSGERGGVVWRKNTARTSLTPFSSPQILHYGVTSVPSFVMLDNAGAARARVGRPADADAAVAAVAHVVGVARPKRVQKK